MADQKTIITIIWVVFAGICFGAFYAYYHRRIVGDLVRAILAKEAFDTDSAVTLSDIGYDTGIKNKMALYILKKGSSVRKIVNVVYEEKAPVRKNEDELFVKAPKADTRQKYFIPIEKRVMVEVKYDGKGTSMTTVLITVAVFFAVALTAVSILPWVLKNAGRLFAGNGSEQTDIPPSEAYTEEVSPEKPVIPEEPDNIVETISPNEQSIPAAELQP